MSKRSKYPPLHTEVNGFFSILEMKQPSYSCKTSLEITHVIFSCKYLYSNFNLTLEIRHQIKVNDCNLRNGKLF